MGQTLREIAEELKASHKKVQLIYAFNGIGKTRLSREFKDLIAPNNDDEESDTDLDQSELAQKIILYYSAFTEDLFYWDNDLDNDEQRKLKIHPNSFTNWVFDEQGQDQNVIVNFQHYSNTKVLPKFNENFSEASFSLPQDGGAIDNIKISKGEESNFIWSVFYSLLQQVVEELKEPDLTNRSTNIFDDLKYVFIDDPVSSLDDNHLIELAVNLADLIKESNGLKFVVSTHNPLFYNVLFSEINSKVCYMLERFEDGTFELKNKQGGANQSFSYHLYIKQLIKQAIDRGEVQKYHFMLLRNLYEKTASFLGYPQWSDLLPDDKEAYSNRIMQFYSHRKLSNEEVAEPTEPEKQMVNFLLNHLIDNYSYWKQGEQNG